MACSDPNYGTCRRCIGRLGPRRVHLGHLGEGPQSVEPDLQGQVRGSKTTSDRYRPPPIVVSEGQVAILRHLAEHGNALLSDLAYVVAEHYSNGGEWAAEFSGSTRKKNVRRALKRLERQELADLSHGIDADGVPRLLASITLSGRDVLLGAMRGDVSRWSEDM